LLTGLARSLLYGVEPADPVSFLGGGAALLAGALIAAGLPAYRAAASDPSRSLRIE
jgi:ABC-type lipoprotein release transport system permease subunit